ncbi:uncharacterized protein M6B38_121620 [Iris pallida]|uniref:FHA domain-containing protein n=1 Tax=Iris pallida TaxID=29817 RepID=A0AAX6H9E0_IRIPA|nr:uncharacterized protein M6B38_121620 [Iris pallida]
MGAPVEPIEWIPEDDLLLKNAIEAGASLASLAKGAVPFSRRFDIEQLEKRWRTLLYGLGSPEEVSARIARIAEIEGEVAPSNPPKANRSCNPKGKESSPGKQKRESIQSHYYAMRKRIRSKPCPADLGFLLPNASNVGIGSGNGSGDLLKPHDDHQTVSFALTEPLLNHYGHPETGYGGGKHAFPEMMTGDSGANDNVSHLAFHSGHVGSSQDEHPGGIMDRNCLYGYTENISSVPVGEAGCNNGDQSFKHNYAEKVFPNIHGDARISVETSSNAGEIAPPNCSGMRNPYENDNIGPQALANFDSTNVNPESLQADFVGNDNLSSQVPHSNDSFHQLGYTAPSGMPIWRTMEDMSTPPIAMDRHYKDKDQEVLAMDDNKEVEEQVCDDANKLSDRMCDAGLSNQTILSGSDLMDFSDTYMDFPDDEDLLFIDPEDKDTVDRSCIDHMSSILLSSPSDLQQDDVAKSSDPRAKETSETDVAISEPSCLGESNVILDQMHSGLNNKGASVIDASVPSTSIGISHNEKDKPCEEFMICLLNTEDQEIPCNDHVIFPVQSFSPFPSTNVEQSSRQRTDVISNSDVLSTDERSIAGDLSKVKDEKVAVAPPCVSSEKASPQTPGVHVLHSYNDCSMEADSSESDSIVGVSNLAGIAIDGPNLCTSAAATSNSVSVAAMKEESTVLGFQKPNSPETFEDFLKNQLEGSDHVKVNPPSIDDNSKEEPIMQVTFQTPLPAQADLVSADIGFSDSAAIIPTSEQDDQISDGEDDVPNFSDIEALILDMDLGPYDQESFLFTKEVSRYQCMDKRKSIVRLEQGARSYMNRAIASQGAFAVFYGRHLKYFIKDPEVSLGRETEDVKVDIDLGREGRANKISRRQAIIKMDEYGIFFLKNTGKFPIFVNSKEVPPKKRIHLLSSSLVEIKDMSFIFEVNDGAVRRYIKNLQESSQENNTCFEWKPNHN